MRLIIIVSGYHIRLIVNINTAQGLTSELISSFHQLLEFNLEGHPMTKFTTQDGGGGGKHTGDDYFLNSGDKIRFFSEECMISIKSQYG